MSMSNKPAKEPIVYVRKKIRKTRRMEEVFGNVVTSSSQQDKEIGQKSFETLHKEPNKYVAKKETKTKRGTKCSNTSKSLNTRQCKGSGAANTKISDNKEERLKTWKPQTSDFSKYYEILTTEEETYLNQLALVDGNINYVGSQLEFTKDLGETAQRQADTQVCSLNNSLQFPPLNNTSWSTYNAKRKGKEVHQENNTTMDFADIYAQRGNKGITVREKSVNSGSEEIAKLLVTSNNHWNQVSPDYFLSNSMNEMNVWPRHHKPRVIVHPSKIISPSTFSQNSDHNMQRTSASATSNFSFMKLLMEDDDSSTLTDEELLNEIKFFDTRGLSSEGQRVQQWPCSQVGNYQFENTLQQINSQSCQYQVLQQPQQISFMDLLTREDISLDLDSASHAF
ncbi:hypothetical protein K7X08_036215 [Anisodus acutangulus]|uniref:Uncharacterized protein n=1 Tax=Anisodus acutangulus TaxID=402998 RepID=A0A9Q1L838_9SOLA|nr:hypothetical protein K7X08_036215 [Anisodus acutangulus]